MIPVKPISASPEAGPLEQPDGCGVFRPDLGHQFPGQQPQGGGGDTLPFHGRRQVDRNFPFPMQIVEADHTGRHAILLNDPVVGIQPCGQLGIGQGPLSAGILAGFRMLQPFRHRGMVDNMSGSQRCRHAA